MAKTKVRKDLAEQKALGIHMLYPDVCTFPVNPIRVANKLGFKVYKDNSQENLDGYYKDDTRRIYLNTDQPINRRRFTVAHELGHALLGHGTRQKDHDKTFSRKNYDPAEVEANTFATCLLMPKQYVIQCIRNNMTFDEMTSFFGVSDMAMAIRLKQVGVL